MKFPTRALAALALPLAVAACSAPSSAAPTPTPPTVSLPASQKPATCKGYVGLTFDDGPTKLSQQYLDVLKFYDVHATFFNIGTEEAKFPDLVTAELNAGHVIGSHTQTHPHMEQLTAAQRAVEFNQPNQIHEEQGHGKFAFWRPPYGGTNPEVRKEGEALGMAEVIWDVDSKDYETPDPKKVVTQSMGMKNGDIILMHDGKTQTLAALPEIINRYYAQGLCFGKLATTTKDRKAENGKPYAVHAVAP